MGFTNQERINLNSKVLAASVIDANESAQWYESRLLNEFNLGANKVLLDLGTIRQYPAANLATAKANAAGPLLGIVDDLSDDGYAVRLTAVPGASGTYVALQTYGDFSSDRLENWLQPQAVPQSSGAASIGYTIALYDGQPGSGGTLVSVTDGTTGTGSTKSVGWIFNYSLGLLLLSADFRGSISDPWVKGFRYIGDTVENIARDGYIAVQEIFTASPGQTDFVLANEPDPNTLMVWDSGIKLIPVTDYIVAGSTVEMTSPMSGGESIHIFYFTSTNGIITVTPVAGQASVLPYQEEIAVTITGQTSFVLSNSPLGSGRVMMFVNKLKQEIADYTVSGNAVTYTGPLTIQTTDTVEFWYPYVTVPLAIAPQGWPSVLSLDNRTDGYSPEITSGDEIHGQDLVGGDLTLRGGNGSGGSNGGDVSLIAGAGSSPGVDGTVNIIGDGYVSGNLDVSGKLTVLGIIDPTGLVLDEQGSVPEGTPSLGKSTLWIHNDGYGVITDDQGVNTILANDYKFAIEDVPGLFMRVEADKLRMLRNSARVPPGLGAWSLTTASISGAGAYGPWRLISTAGSDSYASYAPDNYTSESLAAVSVDAQAGSANYIIIGFSGGATDRVWFNVDTGSVGTSSGAGVIGSSITDLGDGYYRCKVLFSSIGTSLRVYVADADASTISADTSYIVVGRLRIEQVRTGQVENLAMPSVPFTQATANDEHPLVMNYNTSNPVNSTFGGTDGLVFYKHTGGDSHSLVANELASLFDGEDVPFAFYLVVKYLDSSQSSRHILTVRDSGASGSTVLITFTTTNFRALRNAGGSGDVIASVVLSGAVGEFRLYAAYFDGNNVTVVEGASNSNTTALADSEHQVSTLTNFNLGGESAIVAPVESNSQLKAAYGFVGNAVTYGSQEDQKIRAYIANRYGVTT